MPFDNREDNFCTCRCAREIRSSSNVFVDLQSIGLIKLLVEFAFRFSVERDRDEEKTKCSTRREENLLKRFGF